MLVQLRLYGREAGTMADGELLCLQIPGRGRLRVQGQIVLSAAHTRIVSL